MEGKTERRVIRIGVERVRMLKGAEGKQQAVD